jgi:hypothetical protein
MLLPCPYRREFLFPQARHFYQDRRPQCFICFNFPSHGLDEHHRFEGNAD